MRKASPWSDHILPRADVYLVYLQNLVLGELLPKHGIVFLPLDAPWVEDGQVRGRGHGYIHADAAGVELERTAIIGEAFLTRMDYILRCLE